MNKTKQIIAGLPDDKWMYLESETQPNIIRFSTADLKALAAAHDTLTEQLAEAQATSELQNQLIYEAGVKAERARIAAEIRDCENQSNTCGFHLNSFCADCLRRLGIEENDAEGK